MVQQVVLVRTAGGGGNAEVALEAALGEIGNRVGVHAPEVVVEFRLVKGLEVAGDG